MYEPLESTLRVADSTHSRRLKERVKLTCETGLPSAHREFLKARSGSAVTPHAPSVLFSSNWKEVSGPIFQRVYLLFAVRERRLSGHLFYFISGTSVLPRRIRTYTVARGKVILGYFAGSRLKQTRPGDSDN